MDKDSIVKSIFTIAIFAIILYLIIVFVWLTDLKYDYKKEVIVDSSEKVERALEIATEEVKQRGFIIIRLTTTQDFKGLFYIRCYGIEKGNLLKKD